MPYEKANRETTDQQFSEGTTIDGDRLEAGMNDIVDYYNNIPPKSMKRRWMQTQFVQGFQPTPEVAITGIDLYGPFMYTENSSDTAVTVGVPPDAYENPYRHKSCDSPAIEPVPGDGDRLAWTTSFFFNKPFIVQGISIFMASDPAGTVNGYVNNFKWSTVAGPPQAWPQDETPGNWANDISVQLSVDDEFNSHDRRLNDIVLTWNNFHQGSQKYATLPYNGLVAGGYPSAEPQIVHPGGVNSLGLVMNKEALNIPLHRRSRARLAIIVPAYSITSNVASSWTEANGSHKPDTTAWSVCLTGLEEIE